MGRPDYSIQSALVLFEHGLDVGYHMKQALGAVGFSTNARHWSPIRFVAGQIIASITRNLPCRVVLGVYSGIKNGSSLDGLAHGRAGPADQSSCLHRVCHWWNGFEHIKCDKLKARQ